MSVLVLAGCAPTPEPVVVDLADLQGETVEVPIESALIILTDWPIVDTYTAEVADPAIAEFHRGADTGDAAYSPQMTPLQVGTTEVTVSSDEDDLPDVTFTVEVTE